MVEEYYGDDGDTYLGIYYNCKCGQPVLCEADTQKDGDLINHQGCPKAKTLADPTSGKPEDN